MDKELMRRMIAEGDIIPDSRNRLSVEYDEHGLERLYALVTQANKAAVIEAVAGCNGYKYCGHVDSISLEDAVEAINTALDTEVK